MNSPILAIIALEIFLSLTAYMGSYSIEAFNREDKELATFRKILGIMFFISGNLFVFFG